MTRLATLASLASLTFAAAALALAAPAAAAETPVKGAPGMFTHSEHVSYPEASAGPDAMRGMRRRIALAADSVCGGEPTSAAEHGAMQDYRACMHATMAAAMAQVEARLQAKARAEALVTASR